MTGGKGTDAGAAAHSQHAAEAALHEPPPQAEHVAPHLYAMRCWFSRRIDPFFYLVLTHLKHGNLIQSGRNY